MTNRIANGQVSSYFRGAQAQRVRKGEILLGWGLEPQYVYFIEFGFIKVYSISSAGEEFVQAVYGTEDIFPLVWAYYKAPRDLYYEAIDESLLFKVPLRHFDRFANSSIGISRALARHMAYQFIVYSDMIDNLEYKKPGERLAYRLLFLASRFGNKIGQQVIIEGPFTHQLIANSVNLARETVSREFERMEQDDIVSRDSRRIIIKDLHRLKELCSTNVSLKHWGLE